jgi:hypothetical protein
LNYPLVVLVDHDENDLAKKSMGAIGAQQLIRKLLHHHQINVKLCVARFDGVLTAASRFDAFVPSLSAPHLQQ